MSASKKIKEQTTQNMYSDKTHENKSKSNIKEPCQIQSNNSDSTFQFEDNRPQAVTQRKLQELANNSPKTKQLKTFQKIANDHTYAKKIAQLQAQPNHKNITIGTQQPTIQRYYVQNPKTNQIRWEVIDPVPEDYIFQIGTYEGKHGVDALYLDSSALDEEEEQSDHEETSDDEEAVVIGRPFPLEVYEPGGNHRLKNKLRVREGEGISAALDSVLTKHTDLINGYLKRGKGPEIGKWCETHWEFTLPNGSVYMTHELGSRSPNQLIPLRGPGIASWHESGLSSDVFLAALNIARNYASAGNFTITKNKDGVKKEDIQIVLNMLK